MLFADQDHEQGLVVISHDWANWLCSSWMHVWTAARVVAGMQPQTHASECIESPRRVFIATSLKLSISVSDSPEPGSESAILTLFLRWADRRLHSMMIMWLNAIPVIVVGSLNSQHGI